MVFNLNLTGLKNEVNRMVIIRPGVFICYAAYLNSSWLLPVVLPLPLPALSENNFFNVFFPYALVKALYYFFAVEIQFLFQRCRGYAKI